MGGMVDGDAVALTITHQLHGNHPAAGHEVSEGVVERLPLVHCIELLSLS